MKISKGTNRAREEVGGGEAESSENTDITKSYKIRQKTKTVLVTLVEAGHPSAMI